MPTTPKHLLPYPVATDTADVPRDIQALATRLDGVIDRPLSRVSRGAQAGIPPSTIFALQFTTVDVDDLGAWNAGQTSRLTAPVAGWYTVGVAASLGGAVTGGDVLLAARLANPALSPPYGLINKATATALGWVGATSGPLLFAAGQYAELTVGVWGVASFDVTSAALWLARIK